MKECWFNYYQKSGLSYPNKSRKEAIVNAEKSLVMGDKSLYRIHVRLK